VSRLAPFPGLFAGRVCCDTGPSTRLCHADRMADRLDLDGTSTGPVRGAGQLRQWQIGVVCAIAAAIAAVVTGLLDLEIVPHLIAAFVVTLVLGLAGIMVVGRLNRRHR
jgi:hypothetical protein